MFSKSIHLAFVLLALSGLTAHAAPHPSADCESSTSVVTQTVTLSSRDPSPTANNAGGSKAAGASNGSGKQSGSQSSQSKGKGKFGAGSGKNSGSKSGSNNSGSNSASSSSASSATTTSADASTTTSVDNSGSGSAAGSGSDNNGSGNNGSASDSDFNTSLQLDPRVICTGFEQDGQGVATAEPGQVASRTSSNNFINDCLNSPNLPLTNGSQITTGSCNPAPIGVIPSTENVPTQKFQSPKNLDTIQANADFQVVLKINNLDSGNFVNAKTNYFAAPQAVSSDGKITGHTHIVIEPLASLTDTNPTNAGTFTFFQGINTAADANGDVTADVAKGVPAGVYRMCTIVTSANHVPAIGPVAQHGSFDDCIYFTASDNGSAVGSNSTASAGSGSNDASSTTVADSSSSAAADSSSTTAAASETTSAAGSKSTSSATGKNSNQNSGNNNNKGNTNNGNKNQQKGNNGSKFGGKFGRK